MFLDTEQMEQLKKESFENKITVSELVRRKLTQKNPETKTQMMFETILKKLEQKWK